MCGATDCKSCGPAQGYSLLDDEAIESMIQREIGRMRADPKAVSEALGSLTEAAYAETDRLVFEAINGERSGGLRPEHLQAIGQHLVDAVLNHFDNEARKE